MNIHFRQAMAVVLCTALLCGCADRADTADKNNASSGQTQSEIVRQPIYCSFVTYDSFEDLCDNSTDIIECTVGDSFTAVIDENGEIVSDYQSLSEEELLTNYDVMTLYAVDVSGVYKGDLNEGNAILVKLPGGVLDGVFYDADLGFELDDGEKYTVFLSKSANLYDLTSVPQSAYRYSEDTDIYWGVSTDSTFDGDVQAMVSGATDVKNDNNPDNRKENLT